MSTTEEVKGAHSNVEKIVDSVRLVSPCVDECSAD
jgi:hypothetical protein